MVLVTIDKSSFCDSFGMNLSLIPHLIHMGPQTPRLTWTQAQIYYKSLGVVDPIFLSHLYTIQNTQPIELQITFHPIPIPFLIMAFSPEAITVSFVG